MTSLAGTARFTPSLLDHDTLEALFVHREHLVADAIARIERASTSKERASRLFVGPRGAGKTHLISLVYHRAKLLPGFGTSFQLAWLPEDLWTIGDFDDLADQIVESLEPPFEGSDGAGAAEVALPALAAERGPIIVLIENLDQVLDDLGPEGQRRLRALMEGDRSIMLIATATRLGEDLLDQAVPFYGYFDTHTLERFGLDEAVEMLQRIAKARGDEGLVCELATPRARGRLAAVQHLAGGQPRIWSLFGTGLTVEGLTDLVGLLLERFDDLTPYYQERLARLAPNERKVVSALFRSDRSMSVREIAEASRVDQRSLAKTVSDLRDKGWLRARTGLLAAKTDKRRTYYDLQEPLARLAFQLKSSRGQPVKLVIDFLQSWFEEEELVDASRHGGFSAVYAELASAGLSVDAVSQLCRSLSGVHGAVASDGALRFNEWGAAPLARRVDEALAKLDEDDDPHLALQLPAAVSSLIEERLATTPIPFLRWEVHAAALGSPDRAYWRRSLERAVQSSDEGLRLASLLLLLRHHLLASEVDAVAALIDVVLDQVQKADELSGATAQEIGWSVSLMHQQGHTELAAKLMTQVTVKLDGDGLAGLALAWFNDLPNQGFAEALAVATACFAGVASEPPSPARGARTDALVLGIVIVGAIAAVGAVAKWLDRSSATVTITVPAGERPELDWASIDGKPVRPWVAATSAEEGVDSATVSEQIGWLEALDRLIGTQPWSGHSLAVSDMPPRTP